MSDSSLNDARVRFNWGFHDGTLEAARTADGDPCIRNMQNHQDSMYAIAYIMGVKFYKEAGFRPPNSDAAWNEYCAIVGLK